MRRLTEPARFWILVGSINLTIPLLIVWSVYAELLDRTGAFLVCWFGFFLSNAACLVSVRTRPPLSRPPRLRRLYFQVGAVALSGALLTTGYLIRYAARDNYLALARARSPLEFMYPQRTRLIVELIRERTESNRQYRAAAATFHPISPPLYSPESFAGVAVMRDVENQFQQAFQMDSKYAAKTRENEHRFREQMAQIDPEYLQAWIASEQNSDRESEELFTLETRWAQSVQALYDYGIEHHRSMRLRKGSVQVSSPEVKSRFENLRLSSIDLREKLLSARTELLKKQVHASVNSG